MYVCVYIYIYLFLLFFRRMRGYSDLKYSSLKRTGLHVIYKLRGSKVVVCAGVGRNGSGTPTYHLIQNPNFLKAYERPTVECLMGMVLTLWLAAMEGFRLWGGFKP